MSVATFVNAYNNGSFEKSQKMMSYEVARLASFKSRPITVKSVPAPRLVSSGFYYVGPDELVQCYLCNVKIGDWSKLPHPVDPLAVHMQKSPECPFVVNNDKENVPFRVESESPELEEFREELKRAKTPPKKKSPIETDCAHTPIDHPTNLLGGNTGFPRVEDFLPPALTNAPIPRAVQAPAATFHAPLLQNGPAVPDLIRFSPNSNLPDYNDDDRFEAMNYKNEKVRYESFKFWPNRSAVRPHELARCGFYYLGTEDRVQCAFCKGVLRNWDATDVVYDEHKRHFPMCPFIRDPTTCGNEPNSTGDLAGVNMRRNLTGNEVSSFCSYLCFLELTSTAFDLVDRPKNISTVF